MTLDDYDSYDWRDAVVCPKCNHNYGDLSANLARGAYGVTNFTCASCKAKLLICKHVEYRTTETKEPAPSGEKG